jgi:phosphatidylinositol glycan class S
MIDLLFIILIHTYLIFFSTLEIPQWEIDNLVRKRILSYISTSVSTLNSLSLVLSHFSNIQISPKVKASAEKAVMAVDQTIQKVKARDYDSAVSYARAAMDDSFASYSSENIISQLYFPTEHLLAVFLPLLAPFLFPVILKLIAEIKRRRKRTNENKVN